MITQKPWGTYEVLLDEPTYKVKRLVLHPYQQFSLQYHNHREEHWAVVAGSGNVGKILAGIALIGIGFGFAGGFSGGMTFGEFLKAPILLEGGGISWPALAGKLGIVLALSGIAGLLTPTPELDDSEGDPRNSFSFSGIQNTARAGTAIPVIYGDVITGSIPVSARVVTEDSETT